MALTVEEEAKEIEKYIKYFFKEHDDVFNEIAKHIALYGRITEQDIERIVNASISKRNSIKTVITQSKNEEKEDENIKGCYLGFINHERNAK